MDTYNTINAHLDIITFIIHDKFVLIKPYCIRETGIFLLYKVSS